MKKLSLCAAIAFIAISLLVSCSEDNDQELQNETNSTTEVSFDSITYDTSNLKPLPEDVKRAIESMGLKESDFEYTELKLPRKEATGYVINDDILVSKEEFLARANSGDSRQYSTEFIVDVDTFETIDLFFYTGEVVPELGIDGLTTATANAAELAVEGWNAVNSKILFTITYSDDINEFITNFNFETLVSAAFIQASGVAEFPFSDGAPGNFAVIDTGLNNIAEFLPVEGLKHLFTHELGHTIGFRHSDWDTRISCVNLGIEPFPTTESAADRIFGTPSTAVFQPNSIMNACFSFSDATGNLNFFDQTALRVLYGRRFL